MGYNSLQMLRVRFKRRPLRPAARGLKLRARRCATRGVLRPAALLAAFLFYALVLPDLGMVWHDFVPEHDHLMYGAAGQDTGHVHAGDACAACYLPVPGHTLLHAFNPASALQAFGITLGLGAGLLVAVPQGLIQRLPSYPPLRKDYPALPPDPPPTAAWPNTPVLCTGALAA